jgi:hypothetical protein
MLPSGRRSQKHIRGPSSLWALRQHQRESGPSSEQHLMEFVRAMEL